MNPIQIVLGLALALFIPGYLIAKIWFKELSELEKVALGFVFSISIDIFLGLILGYNETMKNYTGGITAFNIWFYLVIITLLLLSYYIYKLDLKTLPRPALGGVRFYDRASRFRDPEIFFLFFLLSMLISQLVFKFQYRLAALLVMVFLIILNVALSYIFNKQYRHVFAVFAILPVFKLLEMANPLNLSGRWAVAFIYFSVLVILGLHMLFSGRRIWKFGFRRFGFGQLLFSIIIGAILGFLVKNIVEPFQGLGTTNSLIGAVMLVLLIVFTEELLFRGIIVTYLKERVGVINAVLFSSLAYMSLLFNGEAFVLALYFVINAILSYMYTKFENIYLSFITHALISLLAFIVLPLTFDFPPLFG